MPVGNSRAPRSIVTRPVLCGWRYCTWSPGPTRTTIPPSLASRASMSCRLAPRSFRPMTCPGQALRNIAQRTYPVNEIVHSCVYRDTVSSTDAALRSGLRVRPFGRRFAAGGEMPRRALARHPRRMVAGEEGVDHRRDEQREAGADRSCRRRSSCRWRARLRARRPRRRSAAPCRRPSPRSSSGSAAGARRPPARSPCGATSPAFRCSWLAKSTIRMPCLEIRPISVIRPICE